MCMCVCREWAWLVSMATLLLLVVQLLLVLYLLELLELLCQPNPLFNQLQVTTARPPILVMKLR